MQHPLLCGPPWRCQSTHLPPILVSSFLAQLSLWRPGSPACCGSQHSQGSFWGFSPLSFVTSSPWTLNICSFPIATKTSNLVRAAFQMWRWRKRWFQIKKSWKKKHKKLVITELHFEYKRNKVIPAGNARPAGRNNDHWKEDKMGSNLEPLTSDSREVLI